MSAVEYHKDLYMGGGWVPASGSTIDVVSPHSEDVIARVATATQADVDRAVTAARDALEHGPWPELDRNERIGAVRRLIERYKGRRAEMAQLICAEMGAPVTFAAQAHVGLPLAMASALCNLAEDIPTEERRPGALGGEVIVRREPVGVVAAVVPWNMPQFLIMTKLVPALLAGCTVVLKPAPETPLDSLLLAQIADDAALPPGVLNIVLGGADTGESLVAHPGIDKVSFTGSTSAGRRVASVCAQTLKKVTLELGGKSAAIVLDDADPLVVAQALRLASFSNSGQICNALTRVLVPAERAEEFSDALAETAAALRVGDPADPSTDLGPLVSRRQRDRVVGYIEDGIGAGARLITGGVGHPGGIDRGWYVQPTVFSHVANSMRIAREEIFGPVIAVVPYKGEAAALEIANDSDYGLAGSVFTTDVERGMGIAARVHTGTFGVNQGYGMDPAAPFGGVKASGFGRELGPEGFDSYFELKSISVAPVSR